MSKKIKPYDLVFVNSELSSNYPMNNGLNQYVTVSDNSVMLNRMKDGKPNELIGSYKVININNRLSLKNNKDLFGYEGFKEELFTSFKMLINDNKTIIDERYDNIVFINNLILRKEYRGGKIFKEFVKHIYRTYYTRNTLIVFLIQPIQEAKSTFFLYRAMMKVTIRTDLKKLTLKEIPMDDYYDLKELDEKRDYEDIRLKLYSLAKKNALDMYDIEGLFYINESKILKLFNSEENII